MGDKARQLKDIGKRGLPMICPSGVLGSIGPALADMAGSGSEACLLPPRAVGGRGPVFAAPAGFLVLLEVISSSALSPVLFIGQGNT